MRADTFETSNEHGRGAPGAYQPIETVIAESADLIGPVTPRRPQY